jgi:hypothetical protein
VQSKTFPASDELISDVDGVLLPSFGVT